MVFSFIYFPNFCNKTDLPCQVHICNHEAQNFNLSFYRHLKRYFKNWKNWHCLIWNELLAVPICDIASLEGNLGDLWRMYELQHQALHDIWTRRGNNTPILTFLNS